MAELNNYNLEERTAKFGEDIIKFCRELKFNVITEPIIKQIIRSATSIGANYMEANGACSKSDFKNKIFICKKETMETKHWLRILSSALPEKADKLRGYWKEAQELTLIFSKIAASSNKK
ncbi:MAG: four helix bundle protein [Patescibacteria group bacterium]